MKCFGATSRNTPAQLLFIGTAVLSCIGTGGRALGQGLLVVTARDQSVRLPRPIHASQTHPSAQSYKIKELDVHAALRDQVARVEVSQSFVNTGSQMMEVAFVFPLPYDGAIDRLTLLIDGKEYPASLLPADQARRRFEELVRKNRDPALLEWLGGGMFQTSIFPVPAGAERKVTLRYTQVCRQDRGLTDFLFPLSTAKYTSHPVEKVRIAVAIESAVDIKNVYSPTHSVEVKRADASHAAVTFAAENEVPTNDFRLFFGVEPGKIGTALLSYRPTADDDGYFLLLASPRIQPAADAHPAKTVVFVIDRSGSMSGQKIEQVKEALKFVLGNLREGDLFNIVAYDSEVTSFRPELQRCNDETRKTALGFIAGLSAGGSTNIDAALKTALAQATDRDRPTYIVFLTDGLPTEGEQSEAKITASAQAANQVRARLIAFGVGYDVNSRLLDKLARGNFGHSEYVRPNENLEAHLSRLYSRIESPVMTDVAIAFAQEVAKPEEGPAATRVYPQGNYDLFEGEQLVVVGRYKHAGPVKIAIDGKIAGQSNRLDFEGEFVAAGGDATYGFIEKLWAVRRVGELIDQIDLKGKNEELIKELVELSTKHGILTPYTSFLADEATDLRALTQNAATAGQNLVKLEAVSGRSGFSQRFEKGRYQYAVQAPASGAARVADAEDGVQRDIATCRSVAQKAFFRRGGRWVDANVTAEQEKAAIRIAQFSDDYFRLAERNGREVSQCMVFDEPVLLNVGNQCYLIEPPAP